MFREVLDLLDRDIASPEQIDWAIRGNGGMRLAAIGPLAITDFAGLDSSDVSCLLEFSSASALRS